MLSYRNSRRQNDCYGYNTVVLGRTPETGALASEASIIEAGVAQMRPAKIYGTGQKVILSVEDDHAAFLLLQLGFSEVGGDFQLYRVEDGEQALQFLSRGDRYGRAPKPDLVLLDLNLPRLTGHD